MEIKQNSEWFFIEILETVKVDPITLDVYKMVKHSVNILQRLLQDFNVCMTILWTPGIIGLNHGAERNIPSVCALLKLLK